MGCCLIKVNRNELGIQPTIAAKQMKAILTGKGSEVFGLAKTNLWR